MQAEKSPISKKSLFFSSLSGATFGESYFSLLTFPLLFRFVCVSSALYTRMHACTLGLNTHGVFLGKIGAGKTFLSAQGKSRECICGGKWVWDTPNSAFVPLGFSSYPQSFVLIFPKVTKAILLAVNNFLRDEAFPISTQWRRSHSI